MELIEAVKQVHSDCHALCKKSFERYLPVAGNIGIFCQSEQEYKDLIQQRDALTYPSDNPLQKYFKLKEPITIDGVTYTYVYIRKFDPSPYGQYRGDVDFVLGEKEYDELKNDLLMGKTLEGLYPYDRPGWDMIQMKSPDIHSVAYISTQEMAEKVHVKFD